ncbi:hypothetical protein [Pseudomonas defluvii]|uniref:hypothetical protein n=1 Tax=Pseudomonas defluvii TaxID=1876757 RepID=UPI0039067528
MLSWDEFELELEEEARNYSEIYRRAAVGLSEFHTYSEQDSAAAARAKAVLDRLDISGGLERPESGRYLRCTHRHGTIVSFY